MQILSTTLLGPGSENTVGDAILSVLGEVDGCIFIDGGGGIAAVEKAREVAGEKYLCGGSYKWKEDYGDARTFALNKARDFGATYACTLDPDERLVLEPNWRSVLESRPDIDVFIVADRDEGYFKERFIRPREHIHWHGPVCEMLRGFEVPQGKLGGHFWELEKDEVGYRARHERGVRLMRKMLETEDDYRWHAHLAACLRNLGDTKRAYEAFIAASVAARPDEYKAWARYCAAECLIVDGRIEDAYELAARGLAANATYLKEFGWILAHCHKKKGDLQQAVYWAQLALVSPKDKVRISHRSTTWERGCLELLDEIRESMAPIEGEAA